MSEKIRLLTRLATLILMTSGLSSSGFCQNEGPPTYRVANLQNLETADAQSYALQLSIEIKKLRGGPSESPHKELGSCCEVHPKPPHCEEVYAWIDVRKDNRKQVRLFVDEHWPKEKTATGELKVQGSTCGSSTTTLDCYKSLLKHMAEAVKEHDEQCHRGRRCKPSSDGFFVNQ